MKKLNIILLAALLAACSGGKEPQRVRIEFWTLQLKPVFTTYIENLVAEYEKAHPGVDVEWVDVPFSGIKEKLMTAYLAGTPPDVVNLNVDMSASMAGLGALADLDKILDENTKKDYLESAWEAGRAGGGVYAVPWYLATNITIYNKEIIAKAGGKVPTNYAELETLAKAVKEKTGKFAICPKIGKDTDILKYFAMDGARVYDGKKVDLGSPEAAAVMDYWKRMFKDEYIPRASVMEDHRVALNMFIREETAIFFSGPQFLKVVNENNPSLYKKAGAAMPIYGKAGLTDIDVMNIAVTSASKHKEQAADFAAFVTNGPNQLAFAHLVPILPSVKSALSDKFFSSKEGGIEQEARCLAARTLLKSRVLITGLPKVTQVQSILQASTQEVFMDKKTTAEGLASAQKEINALISK